MNEKIRLLIVDDEEQFTLNLASLLTFRGFQVSTALDGFEALKAVEAGKPFDVVVLDVKMPRMDGVTTLTRIKKLDPEIEVIMLTGHATVESAIDGMKLGAFDYLMKPCDMERLMEKVKEASARKRQHEDKIIEARMKEITSRRA